MSVNYYLSVMEDAKREIPPAAVAFCDAATIVAAPPHAGFVTLKVPTTLWTRLGYEAQRLKVSTANMVAEAQQEERAATAMDPRS